MSFNFYPVSLFQYFLKREANQFFTSIAIRSLALGMILIFEPIYIFSYFANSLSLTLLFFGAAYGLTGLLVVFAGKAMAKIGVKHTIICSHIFFFGYYLVLLFLEQPSLLIILALMLKAFGMVLFWPAFHTDFARFSEKGYQGRQIGKINVVYSVPTIFSPVIGGAILELSGYPALFSAVLVTLFASALPMLLSRDTHTVYSDTYTKAWGRIFKKENRKNNLAYAVSSMESGVNLYLWPVFMFLLAINFEAIGGITTFSLLAAALFTLYMGRMCDTISNRIWFLNIGSILTSMAWIIKYFVVTPFDAFLAHTIYRICRTSAAIPFQTFFYKKVSIKQSEADEFVIYHEILSNLSRFFFFIILALVFYFIGSANINIAFIIAAFIALGFMFLGLPPKLKW